MWSQKSEIYHGINRQKPVLYPYFRYKSFQNRYGNASAASTIAVMVRVRSVVAFMASNLDFALFYITTPYS